MKRVDNFDKNLLALNACTGRIILAPNDVYVYNINTIYDFIRYVGYAKYLNSSETILLRGQTKLWETIKPALFRSAKNMDKRYKGFLDWAEALRKLHFEKVPLIALASLLQHYGIKTPYLDLVDNVWIALWFATHEAKCAVISGREHVHFVPSSEQYSYVLLLSSDATEYAEESDRIHGIMAGRCTQLIDLRKIVPSRYLRPHAQHAFMLSGARGIIEDYSRFLVGAVRIETRLALQWLGNNAFLRPEILFPSAVFDSGYRLLLEAIDSDSNRTADYGSIQIVSGDSC